MVSDKNGPVFWGSILRNTSFGSDDSSLRKGDKKLKLAFVDCETTALKGGRIWECFCIVDGSSFSEQKHWFIDSFDLNMPSANPSSLAMNHFYDRHPDFNGSEYDSSIGLVCENAFAVEFELLTRGAVLIGCNPGFDENYIKEAMKRNNVLYSCHYRPLDVVTLGVGYLRGLGMQVPPLPWRSDDVATMCGVNLPETGERHTAEYDTLFARNFWYTVMGEKEKGTT